MNVKDWFGTGTKEKPKAKRKAGNIEPWWRQPFRRDRVMWGGNLSKRMGLSRAELMDLALVRSLAMIEEELEVKSMTEVYRDLQIDRINALAQMPGEVVEQNQKLVDEFRARRNSSDKAK